MEACTKNGAFAIKHDDESEEVQTPSNIKPKNTMISALEIVVPSAKENLAFEAFRGYVRQTQSAQEFADICIPTLNGMARLEESRPFDKHKVFNVLAEAAQRLNITLQDAYDTRLMSKHATPTHREAMRAIGAGRWRAEDVEHLLTQRPYIIYP